MPAMSNESNSSSSGGGAASTPGVTQSMTFGAANPSGSHGGNAGVTAGVIPWASLPETFSYEKGTRSLKKDYGNFLSITFSKVSFTLILIVIIQLKWSCSSFD